MVTLDNLVVTTALPVIRNDLHASLASLEWTVNAYTLAFAVLLLTGATLGERFGRRRRRRHAADTDPAVGRGSGRASRHGTRHLGRRGRPCDRNRSRCRRCRG